MKKTVLILLSFVAFVGAHSTAIAQQDPGRIEQRLIDLEEKLFALQDGGRYNNGTLTVNPNESTMLADFEMRLQQLEEESGKVYGAVEELGHSVATFAKKMDLISKDYDLRLQDLEQASDDVKKSLMAIQSATSSLQNEMPKTAKQPETSKPMADNAIKNGGDSKKASEKVSMNVDIPKDMPADDLYAKAYNFLVATAYDDAEIWMSEFLKRHASHKLADNAYYWLGEVYLVKEMPQKAVVNFSTGLSKFPEGAKAPANLLKMGVAFKRMGKNEYAKSSWKKLIHDYKDSTEASKAAKELADLEN